MGNCLTSKGISVHYEKDAERREEEAIERKSISSPKSEPKRHVNGEKEKENERFKLHEEGGNGEESNNGYSKGGGVRIRVVVTQRELIQILSNKSKYSSVGQLLSAMKLKSRKISQVRTSDGSTNGAWRPALQSIPED
ncbi:uncharacterized protein LOC114293578 [Camellia sinensis]|uniref:Uncharacterized protein n=1 Tax=Camellia sinensis var. sinensis TaxID=542762 RepID=A0A4S4DJ35_CAMSN|nr:uncharacterized protein LOC114293578 [Camellia sinensis]THG02861.1 hypothetical protein TEA_026882 [Camellia sinensis var. sinensis]